MITGRLREQDIGINAFYSLIRPQQQRDSSVSGTANGEPTFRHLVIGKMKRNVNTSMQVFNGDVFKAT